MIGKIINSYRIIEEVAAGGFGTLYKAEHLFLNRVVAFKVLHPYHTQEARFLSKFRSEGQFLAQLQHPNIVKVHDAGQDSGYYAKGNKPHTLQNGPHPQPLPQHWGRGEKTPVKGPPPPMLGEGLGVGARSVVCGLFRLAILLVSNGMARWQRNRTILIPHPCPRP